MDKYNFYETLIFFTFFFFWLAVPKIIRAWKGTDVEAEKESSKNFWVDRED